MGGMDIGQTVVVKNKAVMAVEAIEGTDACIRRGGELGRGKSVVVKVAKPNQDVRFDVPAVGKQTIQSMLDSGCTVLAMEAERTLFVEQEEVLKLANAHDLCICAVDKTSDRGVFMKSCFRRRSVRRYARRQLSESCGNWTPA